MPIKFHPATSIFPMMGEEELRELADNIKQQGLLHPIIVHEGEVLDGRNRITACQMVDVEPITEEWKADGTSPVDWIIATNLHRRHLTQSQRAAIAVEALPYLEAEAKERMRVSSGPGAKGVVIRPHLKARARDAAGARMGVSGVQVGRAKHLKREAPETFEQVKAGKITVTAGLRKAGLDPPSQTKPHPAKRAATQPVRHLNLEFPRNQEIANAARRRFEGGLTTIEAAARALTSLNYSAVTALASSDDVAHWFKSLAATASNLRKIRLALKEYQK